MPTIFTRAKAARKVIALMHSKCGITRRKLRCDARLESDLDVVGDDAYDLLQSMRKDLGVDMSGFDCHDHITPEGIPPPVMLLTFVLVFLVTMLLSYFMLGLPRWLIIGSSLGISFILLRLISLLTARRRPELMIRNLVLSVEAGRWVSPKQNMLQERQS